MLEAAKLLTNSVGAPPTGQKKWCLRLAQSLRDVFYLLLQVCVRVCVCACLLTQVWLYELVQCNACSSGSLKRLKGNVEEHLEFVTGAVGHIQSIGISEAAEMAKNMFEMCQ